MLESAKQCGFWLDLHHAPHTGRQSTALNNDTETSFSQHTVVLEAFVSLPVQGIIVVSAQLCVGAGVDEWRVDRGVQVVEACAVHSYNNAVIWSTLLISHMELEKY